MKGIKQAVTLGLALIIVAVMVGLLFWQRNREVIPEELPDIPTQSVRLVDRSENELTQVVFQNQDGTSHVMLPFEDEEGQRQWGWDEIDYQLDTTDTRNKIRGAFALFSNQVIHEDVHEVEGIRLEDFGMGQLIVTAHYDDGTTMNLYLGGPTSDFSAYFFMVEGNPGLFTISRLNAHRFLFALEDMLEISLPIFDTETLDYVLIAERDREVIEFSRQPHDTFEDMTWHIMDQPFPGREVFISNFGYHILERFAPFRLGDLVNIHPTSLAPYGLDSPSLEFIYQAPHGEAHLLFGDVFFKDTDGDEVAYIYVKFADRPHVFEARFEEMRVLTNVDVLRFIERFIALMDIQDVERLHVITPDNEYEIIVNHVEDSTDIAPTVNGIEVADRPFRGVYRQLIGLGIDGEIEPFIPTEPPVHVVTYFIIEGDDIVIRFYAYDDNFLAVSVNGEEIWFVTNRRSFNDFIRLMDELIAE
ncbi:MAG: DUF4340 domain-containing protein [Defluviitaleaceae bacterium]|nr:DUF4340 domain-containing protein [Defluviitaleaceae bacterium]